MKNKNGNNGPGVLENAGEKQSLGDPCVFENARMENETGNFDPYYFENATMKHELQI